jgi:cyclopropane fatty-acyl-phospholipid synthase-like methyltransferase
MLLAALAAIAVTTGATALLVSGLSWDGVLPLGAILFAAMFAVTTLLLAFSAIVALVGIRSMPMPAPLPKGVVSLPAGRCAVLWLIAGEAPEPIAARVATFRVALDASGQAEDCDIFVLSDTVDPQAKLRERNAFAALRGRISYRNRPNPVGRKPGNIHDWLISQGARYDTVLLLDADSGFSAQKLAQLRAQMAANPRLGLVQTAIRLRPEPSRFAQLQRLSARLTGPVMARGLARLARDCGNYWGHNALIRTRALAEVMPLRPLPGKPPFGGPILSHDFVEAAHLRRAGWAVALCADSRGSFEDAPTTLAAHLRRDRRWAQGNLQHLRVIADTGLHPVSRLHLAQGILAYLAAPMWLTLVLLLGTGAVGATPAALWALASVMGLILVPKFAAFVAPTSSLARRRSRRVLVRALGAELALSTVFAPIAMLWRSGFVLSTFLGRAVEWVPSGQAVAQRFRPGRAELFGGTALLVAVAVPQALAAGAGGAWLSVALVLPLAAPLLAAPLLWRWFDATPAKNAVEEYYDQSTRRFLAMGGSGASLAIHRPLWADGVQTTQQAAAHINTVIAAQAEAELGRSPSRVVDLGCGVGGTIFHLAHHWPETRFTGVTISAEQVALAQGFARDQGLAARCSFVRSDFTLPMTLERADLAIAVESHVHAESAAAFLQAALRHLQPGGVLVVVDDMLAAPETSLAPDAARRLAQFRAGWRLGHVPDPDGLAATASQLGFELTGQQDLTPYLRLNRLRDHALRVAGPVADRLGLAQLPVFGNMIGGNALTESYRAGMMRYTCVVLRKPSGAQSGLPQSEAVA